MLLAFIFFQWRASTSIVQYTKRNWAQFWSKSWSDFSFSIYQKISYFDILVEKNVSEITYICFYWSASEGFCQISKQILFNSLVLTSIAAGYRICKFYHQSKNIKNNRRSVALTCKVACIGYFIMFYFKSRENLYPDKTLEMKQKFS